MPLQSLFSSEIRRIRQAGRRELGADRKITKAEDAGETNKESCAALCLLCPIPSFLGKRNIAGRALSAHKDERSGR
jgi:hypothetical protein